jgi:hypothetical protein
VSNADVGQTIAKLLGLQMRNKGWLVGRVTTRHQRRFGYSALIGRSRC